MDLSDSQLVDVSPERRFRKFNKKIGRGSSKQVNVGYDTRRGRYVAWNHINLGKSSEKVILNVKKELDILIESRNKNKHILSFYCSWYNEEENSVIFITDIYLAGDLRHFIDSVKIVSIPVIRKWCGQILDGLKFLHGRNIVHRDLKCANIFIDPVSGDIVIGDFGISRELGEGEAGQTVVGTPEYMAPEMFEENHSFPCDIYSFGMLLLEMLTMDTPFGECKTFVQIYKKISTQTKPELLEMVNVKHARDLIEKCTAHNPDERPSIDQILQHDFFTDKSIENVVLDMNDNEPKNKLKEIFSTKNEMTLLKEESSSTESSKSPTETSLASVLLKEDVQDGIMIMSKNIEVVPIEDEKKDDLPVTHVPLEKSRVVSENCLEKLQKPAPEDSQKKPTLDYK